MDALEVPEGPPMKRSRSDQGPVSVSLQHEDAASNGSMASAPDRIEGNEEEGEEYDESDDDGVSMSASIFEDVLDEAEDRPYRPIDDDDIGFQPQQAKEILSRLRRHGAQAFVQKYYDSGRYTVRHLATAFGVRPDLPYGDSWYAQMLSLCIQRELRRRQKLKQYNTLDDAVALLQESSNILVITGAGISTSLGIPDFRSKNTGFYSRLVERGFAEPEDVFDIHLFDEDPTIFYSLAKEILPVTGRCSVTHGFIKLIQDKGKLLTNYTQNIDNIEQFAGISQDKLLQCHGSWATASCRKCGHTVKGPEIFDDVQAQRVPRCKECVHKILSGTKPARKRKRAAGGGGFLDLDDDDSDGEFDIPEPGVMKPGITFFHEPLPDTFFERLSGKDRALVDLVVVAGTSMKVSPVNQIPGVVPSDVPHIYISREPCRHIDFDIQLVGDCDRVVSELSRRAGWAIVHDGFDSGGRVDVKVYDGKEGEDGWWRVEAPGQVENSGVAAVEEAAALAGTEH